MARANERTRRRVEALEAMVRDLGDNLAALSSSSRPTSPAAGAGAAPAGVRSWLLAEQPGGAADCLTELVGWLNRVYLAYNQVTLPSCWLWHPAVVEELWWLYQAHADAYHPVTGSWLRVGDWHDRQRLNVVGRVRSELAHCNPARHRSEFGPVRGNAVSPTLESIDTVAAWLAGGRRHSAPLPPLPPDPGPVVPSGQLRNRR
jgi:hypothetical protein